MFSEEINVHTRAVFEHRLFIYHITAVVFNAYIPYEYLYITLNLYNPGIDMWETTEKPVQCPVLKYHLLRADLTLIVFI